MHNSYFFLRHLTQELKEKLNDFTIVSCFSQNKDELIIELNNRSKSFFIKAHLQPDFCCLSFPSSFNRARKNSIDLFQDVILKKVEGVRQFENERSFALELSGGFNLLFKMHGNRSNVILFNAGIAMAIFRNHLKADLTINLESLDRQLEWSFEYFKKHESDLKKGFFTLSNDIWEHLNRKGFYSLNEQEQWESLRDLNNQLKKGEYFIVRNNGSVALSLYEYGETVRKHKHATEAINDFFHLKMQTGSLEAERFRALKIIQEKEKQIIRYTSKNKTLLQSLETDQPCQLWADLIMANLHLIRMGEEKVVLANHHQPGKSVEIKLKKDLSPQKNAEAYFRKAKNQKIEIRQLTESLLQKEADLINLGRVKQQIEQTEDLISLNKLLSDSGLLNTSQSKTIRLPYREVEYKGYSIRIGRNAKDNDELTLKFAHKEDLWLHAKDVSGSHVVIKHQSGKTFPKDVIERAAELAAFHSKRKGESLCPVAVTQKKFVRKRKGDPPGLVIVEKEKVIMVEPRN